MAKDKSTRLKVLSTMVGNDLMWFWELIRPDGKTIIATSRMYKRHCDLDRELSHLMETDVICNVDLDDVYAQTHAKV